MSLFRQFLLFTLLLPHSFASGDLRIGSGDALAWRQPLLLSSSESSESDPTEGYGGTRVPRRPVSGAGRGACSTGKVRLQTKSVLKDGRPLLEWSVSTIEHPIRVVISEVDADEPLVDTVIAPPAEPGTMTYHLDPSVPFDPSRAYGWSVQIFCNPSHPSANPTAIYPLYFAGVPSRI